jgi:YD repeat-containing protein
MSQHPGGTLGHDTERFDYDGSGNLIYVGVAHPGELAPDAVWQIRKFAYDGSGNLLSVFYANASKKFDQIWDNRAALTYL